MPLALALLVAHMAVPVTTDGALVAAAPLAQAAESVAEQVMRASRRAAQCSEWTVSAARGARAEEQAMIRAAMKASVADERERRKQSRAMHSETA